MNGPKIVFNKPYMTGKELDYIAEATFGKMLASDGSFTEKCHSWLQENTGCSKALLTYSSLFLTRLAGELKLISNRINLPFEDTRLVVARKRGNEIHIPIKTAGESAQ
jgi:hypothetical protein